MSTEEKPSQNGIVKAQTQAMVDPKTSKPRGLQNIDREDIVIPRIAIAQATTQRVQDGEVRVGALYNTVTGETFVGTDGKPYIEFIPIGFSKSRRLWDRKDKNNSICMSNDSRISVAGKVCATECPHNAYDWGVSDTGERLAPACTLYFNYLALPAPYNTIFPLSISMGRTSSKTAKQFNSVIVMTGEDIFSRIYAISTESKENNKGRFHIFKVKLIGKAAPDRYKRAEAMAAMMATTSYSLHEEGEKEEAGYTDDVPF